MNRYIRFPVLVASLIALGATSLASPAAFAGTPTPQASNTATSPNTPILHAGVAAPRVHAQAPVGLLEESLHLQLRPEQRAQIEQLRTGLIAGKEATKAARQGLVEALAAEVQLGRVDQSALQARIDFVADAAIGERAQDRAAINKLHAVLDKPQRKQLADDMAGKLASHHPVHLRASNELRRLARELQLTRDQRHKVGMILRDEAKTEQEQPSTRQAKVNERKVIEAFKGDVFAMDKAVPHDARTKTEDRVKRFVDVVTKVEPLLTAAQRGIAASKLHQRAINGAMML